LSNRTFGFVTCFLVLVFNTSLHGQVYTTTGNGPWSWNDPNDWTCDDSGGGTCAATPPTMVTDGITVNINHGNPGSRFTINSDIVIENGGTVNIVGASATSGVFLDTNNDILVKNGGTLNTKYADLRFSSQGGIGIDSGATFNVEHINIYLANGDIDNSGTINIVNKGCFTLRNGGFVNQSGGVLNANGAEGALYLHNGDITNDGTWNANIDWCSENGTSGGTLPPGPEDCEQAKAICDASVLPVELTAFITTATATGVQLNWTTESETENLGFVLERRTGEAEFAEIASYNTNDALLGQGSVEYATDYEYVDSFVEAGQTYEYRLGDVDYYGVVTYHATRSVTVTTTLVTGKINQFTLLDAYPNPFNPNTTLKYSIPNYVALVNIQVFDISGKLVKTLVDEKQSSGWHEIQWDGTNQSGLDMSGGAYLARVKVGNEIKTTKLMLLK